MTPTEFPTLSLDYLFARVWRKRWLVLACGLLGGLLTLGTAVVVPKYQVEIEVQPPTWEAVASLNQTGLVMFERKELYSEFLRNSVSSFTGQFVWEQVMKKREPGLPNGRNIPVSAEVLGGLPQEDSPVASQRIVVTGASAEEISTFLSESVKASRQKVMTNAAERLQAAVLLHLAKISFEISRLESGELGKLEAQRYEDRRSALQGSRFEEVPLAYLGLDELRVQQQFFQNFEVPANINLAAEVDLAKMEQPRDWYTKMHAIAGLLIGLLVGSWLAVAWKPSTTA